MNSAPNASASFAVQAAMKSANSFSIRAVSAVCVRVVERMVGASEAGIVVSSNEMYDNRKIRMSKSTVIEEIAMELRQLQQSFTRQPTEIAIPVRPALFRPSPRPRASVRDAAPSRPGAFTK
ncbi:hypothetical protein GCM10020220_049760 [Nonomuraea rubra]|uniref:hypothetical protein n=1 Tax=Nonomuraea rubra TaxID=46180 RepID=UPI0031EC0C5E